MKRTNASGHLQNLTSLEGLCDFCQTLGTLYNPPNVNLQVASMQLLITQGHQIHLQLVGAESKFNTSVAARQTAFTEFRSIMAQVRNIFQVSCPDENLNAQFDAIFRKLVGKRATDIPKTEVKTESDPKQPEKKYISASQTGFDDKLANFEKLLTLLDKIDSYQPKEEKFTWFGLNTYFNYLKEVHSAVNQSIGPLIESRNSRNYFFYNNESGIVILGRRVKKYLRAVLKPSNLLYKDVSKFIFKNYRPELMINIPGAVQPAPTT